MKRGDVVAEVRGDVEHAVAHVLSASIYTACGLRIGKSKARPGGRADDRPCANCARALEQEGESCSTS